MKSQNSAVFLTLILMIACSPVQKEPDELETGNLLEKVAYVKTAEVQQTLENTAIQSMGVIVSKTEAKPAFKTGGIIAQTFFREGDVVREGQVLATLLMTEINAQVEQAQEGVVKAERDLQRVTNLHADSVATLEQLENTATVLHLSRQNLAIAEFNQKHSEVRSPISGKIIRQQLHAGEIAAPGMPVYVIMGINNRDWRIKTGLIDREWSQVKKGDVAAIRMDAYPGEIFEAIVSDKAVISGNASGTLDVELSFKNMPPALAVGMICKVQLQTQQRQDLITIPIDALVGPSGDMATVFTINEGRARKIPITISRILGERVVVNSGLEGISEVVTIGSNYLEDGDQVAIAEY